MNTAVNSLNSASQLLSKIVDPLAALYYKAFNYNKYLAGTGFAALITLALFFLMVALINLGDDSLPTCLLYTSPSPRDGLLSRMPSSA